MFKYRPNTSHLEEQHGNSDGGSECSLGSNGGGRAWGHNFDTGGVGSGFSSRLEFNHIGSVGRITPHGRLRRLGNGSSSGLGCHNRSLGRLRSLQGFFGTLDAVTALADQSFAASGGQVTSGGAALLRANARSSAGAVPDGGLGNGLGNGLGTWQYAFDSNKRIFANEALAARGGEIASRCSALLRPNSLSGTGKLTCRRGNVGVDALLAIANQTFAASAGTSRVDGAALDRALVAIRRRKRGGKRHVKK